MWSCFQLTKVNHLWRPEGLAFFRWSRLSLSGQGSRPMELLEMEELLEVWECEEEDTSEVEEEEE